MTTGRSLVDFQSVYIDGYDLSAYLFDVGEIGVEYPQYSQACFSDSIPGVVVGKPTVSAGPLLGVFDNTATTGLHVLSSAAQGTLRHISILRGVRAVPAIGDDVFCAPVYQTGYKSIGDGLVTCRTDLSGADVDTALLYDEFWGKVLHTMVTCGAANASDTAGTVDNGAATTGVGGWMMYHIYSVAGGAGTVTISIDDSALGTGDWLALSGATSGAIAYSAAPTSGIIQLGVTADIRRYTRWQYAEAGGATDAVFALALIRGR